MSILLREFYTKSETSRERLLNRETVNERLLDAMLRHRHYILMAENGVATDVVMPYVAAGNRIKKILQRLPKKLMRGPSIRPEAIEPVMEQIEALMRTATTEAKEVLYKSLETFIIAETKAVGNILRRAIPNVVPLDIIRESVSITEWAEEDVEGISDLKDAVRYWKILVSNKKKGIESPSGFDLWFLEQQLEDAELKLKIAEDEAADQADDDAVIGDTFAAQAEVAATLNAYNKIAYDPAYTDAEKEMLKTAHLKAKDDLKAIQDLPPPGLVDIPKPSKLVLAKQKILDNIDLDFVTSMEDDKEIWNALYKSWEKDGLQASEQIQLGDEFAKMLSDHKAAKPKVPTNDDVSKAMADWDKALDDQTKIQTNANLEPTDANAKKVKAAKVESMKKQFIYKDAFAKNKGLPMQKFDEEMVKTLAWAESLGDDILNKDKDELFASQYKIWSDAGVDVGDQVVLSNALEDLIDVKQIKALPVVTSDDIDKAKQALKDATKTSDLESMFDATDYDKKNNKINLASKKLKLKTLQATQAGGEISAFDKSMLDVFEIDNADIINKSKGEMLGDLQKKWLDSGVDFDDQVKLMDQLDDMILASKPTAEDIAQAKKLAQKAIENASDAVYAGNFYSKAEVDVFKAKAKKAKKAHADMERLFKATSLAPPPTPPGPTEADLAAAKKAYDKAEDEAVEAIWDDGLSKDEIDVFKAKAKQAKKDHADMEALYKAAPVATPPTPPPTPPDVDLFLKKEKLKDEWFKASKISDDFKNSFASDADKTLSDFETIKKYEKETEDQYQNYFSAKQDWQDAGFPPYKPAPPVAPPPTPPSTPSGPDLFVKKDKAEKEWEKSVNKTANYFTQFERPEDMTGDEEKEYQKLSDREVKASDRYVKANADWEAAGSPPKKTAPATPPGPDLHAKMMRAGDKAEKAQNKTTDYYNSIYPEILDDDEKEHLKKLGDAEEIEQKKAAAAYDEWETAGSPPAKPGGPSAPVPPPTVPPLATSPQAAFDKKPLGAYVSVGGNDPRRAQMMIDKPLGGHTWGDRIDKTYGESVAKMKTSLVDSVRKGHSVPKAARGLKEAGIPSKKATLVARTEMQRVSNDVLEDVYSKNKHVLQAVQGVETLDGRTCLRCAVIDGKLWDMQGVPVGGHSMPKPTWPIHPACRGLSVPIVKSWQDLGLSEGDLKATTRASMNGQVPGSLNYEQWFKTQPDDFQKKVLGPAKFKKYKDGKLKLGQMSKSGRILPLDELPDVPKKPVTPQVSTPAYAEPVSIPITPPPIPVAPAVVKDLKKAKDKSKKAADDAVNAFIDNTDIDKYSDLEKKSNDAIMKAGDDEQAWIAAGSPDEIKRRRREKELSMGEKLVAAQGKVTSKQGVYNKAIKAVDDAPGDASAYAALVASFEDLNKEIVIHNSLKKEFDKSQRDLHDQIHPPKPKVAKPKMYGPKPPPKPRAPTVKFPKDPNAMREIKNLGGSTGAMLVEDPATGKKYVLKRGANPDHLREESIADDLYGSMGIAVPKHKLYETDRGPVKLAEFVEGRSLADFEGKPEWEGLKKQMHKNYAADALLGNWDVVGMSLDNVLVDKSGKIWRIDNGGSLRFRAMGDKKVAGAWDGSMTDLFTMKDLSFDDATARSRMRVFGDMDYRDVVKEMGRLTKDKQRGNILKKAAKGLPLKDVAIIEQRLEEMAHLHEMGDAFAKDKMQWKSEYIDNISRHSATMRKEPWMKDFKANQDRGWDFGHGYDTGSYGTQEEWNDTPDFYDKDGKQWDSMRGDNNVYQGFKGYLDCCQGEYTGSSKIIELWSGEQGGSSQSDGAEAIKHWILRQNDKDKKGFYRADQGERMYQKKITAYMRHNPGVTIEEAQKQYDNSFSAWHAYNYEVMHGMKHKRKRRVDGKWVMDLVRTEQADVYREMGRPTGRKKIGTANKRHAAYVSTSMNTTFDYGDHLSYFRDVPIHRIFGTYLQEKDEVTPGGQAYKKNFFMGDNENEAILIPDGLTQDFITKKISRY